MVGRVFGGAAAADSGLALKVPGWRMRSILRAGAFELSALKDIPTEIVIDEYVEIAKSFFEGVEPGFVNGALDGIARDERG